MFVDPGLAHHSSPPSGGLGPTALRQVEPRFPADTAVLDKSLLTRSHCGKDPDSKAWPKARGAQPLAEEAQVGTEERGLSQGQETAVLSVLNGAEIQHAATQREPETTVGKGCLPRGKALEEARSDRSRGSLGH